MRVVVALGETPCSSRASGQPAAIGALTDAADILTGRAGTTISTGPVSSTGATDRPRA